MNIVEREILASVEMQAGIGNLVKAFRDLKAVQVPKQAILNAFNVALNTLKREKKVDAKTIKAVAEKSVKRVKPKKNDKASFKETLRELKKKILIVSEKNKKLIVVAFIVMLLIIAFFLKKKSSKTSKALSKSANTLLIEYKKPIKKEDLFGPKIFEPDGEQLGRKMRKETDKLREKLKKHPESERGGIAFKHIMDMLK